MKESNFSQFWVIIGRNEFGGFAATVHTSGKYVARSTIWSHDLSASVTAASVPIWYVWPSELQTFCTELHADILMRSFD